MESKVSHASRDESTEVISILDYIKSKNFCGIFRKKHGLHASRIIVHHRQAILSIGHTETVEEFKSRGGTIKKDTKLRGALIT